MYDIHPLTHDIHHFLKHLKTLARPKSLPRSYGAQAYIQSIPKGKVLIFGPFNFPTSLIIRPLIAALAAGNVCCLKPSELTPASEAFLSKLLQYLDPRVVSIVTGGADTCEELLKLKWDHIMFTGSAEIGRIVMAAASKHLTPVTLELGGKCPALITQSADINTAVMGVLRARFGNCGQFCLAAVSWTSIFGQKADFSSEGSVCVL